MIRRVNTGDYKISRLGRQKKDCPEAKAGGEDDMM
jgi:hypothetical protein